MELSAKNIMQDVASKNKLLKEVDGELKQKLQETLTQMLADIQNACEKNGIKVVLFGGTLLGAIRHKGFIPWDDDLDIAIMREDWELLKIIFDEILGDKYELEAPNYGNKDSKYQWPKIYRKGTEWVDIIDVNVPYNKGIFIDIYVIENVANNKLTQYLDAFVSSFVKYVSTSILFYKYPNQLMNNYFASTRKSSIYYRLRQTLGFLFSFVSHKTWLDWGDKFISRHTGETPYVTIPTGTHRYFGEMFLRKVWIPYKEGVFEGLRVNVPNDADDYLTKVYGNYMQLPPVEERETHLIVRLKFPND